MISKVHFAALAVAAITVISVSPWSAEAQTGAPATQKGFTDQELEHMSQVRMREMPKRDWGAPPPQSAIPPGPKLSPLPEPATCLSTASEDEPILASPDLNAKQIGIAPGRIAVTRLRHGAFTKVIYTGTRIGWIPTAHLVAFHATGGGSATTCTVSGVMPNGMIAYHVN